jgi:hypothetical protein
MFLLLVDLMVLLGLLVQVVHLVMVFHQVEHLDKFYQK